ncbi:hypothetical protein SAMN04489751_0770 [Brevibacterium sandarakinum]|uniref:Uncharacterized protein n=1 Tax=Brevibacterium sandarakinum TaxID=629680 RepID=A0A1H1MUW5_BRESA|nr:MULTISPECIES: hypothetical protein [Brevibacterium]RCS91343.1 hypothetical protein CIK63_04660 [Brevibacterium aurantiacum]SDR90643.1 hypothetical protein SAMN04489751_0770 [Brevibacterium sandarakinum]
MSEIFERKKIPRISPREAGRIVGALAEISTYEGRHRDVDVDDVATSLRDEALEGLAQFVLGQTDLDYFKVNDVRRRLSEIHAVACEGAEIYGARALQDMADAAAEGLATDEIADGVSS